jgi:hypothetical protein
LGNPQHEYTKRLMTDVPLMHGRESILTRTGVGRKAHRTLWQRITSRIMNAGNYILAEP